MEAEVSSSVVPSPLPVGLATQRRGRCARWVMALALLLSLGGAHADPVDSPARAQLGRKLLIAGGVLAGTGYLAGAALGLADYYTLVGSHCRQPYSNSAYLWGLLPVAGSWVQVGYATEISGTAALMHAIPGILQAGGVALVLSGALLRRGRTVQFASTR